MSVCLFACRNLVPVTQLYVSVDASTKESLKKIDRPLFRDFWPRFLSSLDELNKKVTSFALISSPPAPKARGAGDDTCFMLHVQASKWWLSLGSKDSVPADLGEGMEH